MAEWKHLRLERGEGWALLTVSRPKVLNALSRETLEELDDALTHVERDGGIKALIITGEGEKAFVAGADISELSRIGSADEARRQAEFGQRIMTRIERLPKPVIMAVNGYALGGGFELALSGDIILASDKARFGLPEVNLGVIPGYGGTQRLARLVGRNTAKYLCMTGQMISADEALRIGVVQKVVPAGSLLDEAKSLAAELAKKAPVSLRLIKRTIDRGLETDLETGLDLEAGAFGVVFDTRDRAEGMEAFLQKRTPEFKGE
ncbi:enoyl-CoA hydratase/isomerase family protein [Staphylospora marina]|uniref:enoyl-CoA hydratase/isomerase family protein n=1 Tax=Staphylospora marina TaxID=2490858 RepID=UPI000F5BAB48|nr:enoyl-CoA hydratase-related protein [Staphylospora marina]